tara:strand:- start:1352 stop:2551 length:1200 start_codon:yes stop_codon:yes gene_type:complete
MARVIILAAGKGTRLRPLTEDYPKAMVKFQGKSIIERQKSLLENFGFSNITCVGGYKYEKLLNLEIPVIINNKYDKTNMVESLFCCKNLFDCTQPILISYGDILYEKKVLEAVIGNDGDIVVASDKKWRELWSLRMNDYSGDIESFCIDEENNILELGGKVNNEVNVLGQFIGLIYVKPKIQKKIIKEYDLYKKEHNTSVVENMYMTSFLQLLIDKGYNIKAAMINNGWIEIDTVSDLKIYESLAFKGNLSNIFNCVYPITPKSIIEDYFNKYKKNTIDKVGIIEIENLLLRSIDFDILRLDRTIKLIDIVSRKIEIVGKVYSKYDSSSYKPLKEMKEINIQQYITLLAIIVLSYDFNNDYRRLNTSLKLLDILKKYSINETINSLSEMILTRVKYCDK